MEVMLGDADRAVFEIVASCSWAEISRDLRW